MDGAAARKLFVTLLASVLLLASSGEVSSADMDWDYTRGRLQDTVRVFVSGEIEPGDLTKLQEIYALGEGVLSGKQPIKASRYQDWSCRYAPTSVCASPDEIALSPDNKTLEPLIRIDSPGGDVAEAMRIGRWLRQRKASVAVPINGQCASACVFVLAAGVNKIIGGEVVIHRPYFRSRPNTDVAEELRKALNETRLYLSEMNIPESLADEMFSIAPQDRLVLTSDALTRYRLDGEDIVEQEEDQLRRAEQLGISRDELMRRLQSIKKAVELGACKDKIPAGKPQDESDAWLQHDRCIVELNASFGIED